MSNSTKAKKLAQAAAEFRSYDDEGNECWEVETILDRKYSRAAKDFLYLIKWKGWRIEDSTWEPVENLLGSLPMLEEFEKNFQELVIPLEPAYAIIGPESHPMTIEDLKKSKSSSGLKVKKEEPPSNDRKPKKQVEQKPKKEKKVSNRADNEQKAKKKSEDHIIEASEALMTDSSSHKSSERPKEVVVNESLGIEVKAECFDKKQSQSQIEYIESPEILIHPFQFECGQETICKQEPSDHESLTAAPVTVRQENTDLKNIETTNHIFSESQMKEKGLDNENQSNEDQGTRINPVDKSTVGSLTVSMTEEVNCPMEVEASLQSHNTNMEHSESATPLKLSEVTEQAADLGSPVNEPESLTPPAKESSNILVGGLIANFSSSKSLTMPDQVCFGRSELVPHFEQPKPKVVKSNGVGCGFFTEKTKGLSRKQTDPELIEFYSAPSKFQGSSGGGVRLNGKLFEPNRVRYKPQTTKAIPDVKFDWKDIMQWANTNKIVVGAVSEMKNKIRKAIEAEERKARRQKSENGDERSESKKKTTKRSKIRSRGTRTEEKSSGKKDSGKDRELLRDKERDKRENSVVSNQERSGRRISRRLQKDNCDVSESQLDEILRMARRKKKKMRNGETQSLSLDPEDDDFELELNFGIEDEQRVFGSEDLEGSSDNDSDSESAGWGLGTTIFVDSNIETEI